MDNFTKKSILFLIFTSVFGCKDLAATPLCLELRSNDLPKDEQGYLLPRADAQASRYLNEICNDASDIDNGIIHIPLDQSVINNYAPCLSIIAQGERQAEQPFVTVQKLRNHLKGQSDLYNAIEFAHFLTVPLLLRAALAEAPAHITRNNVNNYQQSDFSAAYH